MKCPYTDSQWYGHGSIPGESAHFVLKAEETWAVEMENGVAEVAQGAIALCVMLQSHSMREEELVSEPLMVGAGVVVDHFSTCVIDKESEHEEREARPTQSRFNGTSSRCIPAQRKICGSCIQMSMTQKPQTYSVYSCSSSSCHCRCVLDVAVDNLRKRDLVSMIIAFYR